MKKLFLFFTFLTGVAGLKAQSVEQGKQQLYYERYRSAETTFQQVLKQNPSEAEAWYGLAKTLLLQKQAGKAMDALSQAPAGVKGEPFYQVAYGAVLLQQGKNAEAGTYFSEALKETKAKKPEILSAVAEAHILAPTGDGNYAVELLNKAIKKDKHNAALYVELGDAYRTLHNGSEAYKAYQKAVEEDDKYAAAYHQIGDIFLSQKNVDVYTEYYNKALAADPNYAPSIYRLYAHEFYRNPSKALSYYQDYISKSDSTNKAQYELADLYYINKQYQEAIQKARAIQATEGDSAQPRLYKLIAYSYAAQKDTTTALVSMQRYFDKGTDSTIIGRDYLTMGDLLSATQGQDSLATVYYEKGAELEKDSAVLYGYFKKLADYAAAKKDFSAQAKWMGRYYAGNEKANNLDLFNWGLAHIRAEEYAAADSVFTLYVTKYPEQSYGYYWQAKSKALLDNGMKGGLAIPAYQKLIEVLEKNTADPNYKKWIVEAYGYLAAYETNTEKDYPEAVRYFEKVLEVDPENADAQKYLSLLEKSLADKEGK
ncbi:MAG TPA: tetratricopeptide repeat protein [Flavisolibacter sp.]|nr:tetratricopeptide repeat protein [Flavisolibacter sp.]